MPENEEELPSHVDRCTSLSRLRRCTTEAKWKRSNDWIQLKCRVKKYYRMDEKHNPNKVISRTEKSTAQVYFQLKTGHALIGPYLKRIGRTDDNTCWRCLRGVVRTREHLFKHCTRWHQNQKVLWQAVKSASGRSVTNTSIKDYCGIDDAARQWFSTCAQQKLGGDFVSEDRKKMTQEGVNLSV
jgi:hypothetical protein